jgi:hypothetical protein
MMKRIMKRKCQEKIIFIMKIEIQGKMSDKKHFNTWLSFVNIGPKRGSKFNDLIEIDSTDESEYIGAWANLLIKSDRINEVPSIIEKGLNELDMGVIFIDKIENVDSLIEYDELEASVIEEANWLVNSEYVFKISDRIFPYL